LAALRVDIDKNRSAWADAPSSYRPEPPLATPVEVDVAIVGGGLTGVSTALHLAERFPERRIALLEAQQLANGASGRNGGMVLNWVNGVEGGDPERARRIYEVTRAGIDRIEALTAAHGLQGVFRRDGCLEVFTDPARAAAAAQHAEWLQAAGVPVRFLAPAELARTLRVEGAAGALFDPHAGSLDGVGFLRGLKPALLARGVRVYEDTPVLSVREGATCTLTTPRAEIRAAAIVLATNAYTPGLGYFRSGVLPLHAHVVATEPLSAERWAEIGWGAVSGFSDDLDRVAYASLTPEGRLVFGGGSNSAYGYQYGGNPSWRGTPTAGFAAVEARMRRYLPGTADVAVTSRWTGPVAVTLARVPTMGVRGDHLNVYFALGYSGHGLTLATLAGQVLTDLYSGDGARWRGLPFYQHPLLWIPPEPARWAGYHAVTALTGRSPRRRL